MSVAESSTVDGVALDSDVRELVLLITDHLDWEDSDYHWRILGEKINAYLIFLSGDQVANIYPKYDSAVYATVIFVVFAYDLDRLELRDKFAAFGEALFMQGVRLVGRFEDADHSIREYGYAPS